VLLCFAVPRFGGGGIGYSSGTVVVVIVVLGSCRVTV